MRPQRETGRRRPSTVGAPITEITPWDVFPALFLFAEMIKDKTCMTFVRHLLALDVEKVNKTWIYVSMSEEFGQ